MKKVLTIGGATRDIFIVQDHPQMVNLSRPEGEKSFLVYEAGRKVEIKELSYYTGGGATNAAASFKALGFDVSIFCKVGSDQEGDYIIKDLQSKNIDISAIIRDATRSTAISFILTLEDGDTVALVYRGANLAMQKSEISEKVLQGVDQLYITSLGGESAALLLPLVQLAKSKKCNIAVNPGANQLSVESNFLQESLPFIDTLILNKAEAQQYFDTIMQREKTFDLALFCREVMERGPKTIVVTNGKEGVYVVTNGTIYFHPSLPTAVVCSLGAGDAFGSTFIGWLLHGATIEDSLRAGLLNSSSVIKQQGAKSGLLSYDEINMQLQKLDKTVLEKYPL